MFGRDNGVDKTTGQIEKKESQTIFPKRVDATHPVSVYPTKPQTEYVYTLLPDKERTRQRKNDKVEIVPLKKEKVHEVDMENLFDFCQIDIRSALDPEYILGCKISDQQMKKLEKDSLNAFYNFLKFWKNNIGFDELRLMEGWTDDNFVKFCEELSNLFDEFFLLPEKYKLFVRELAKAIHKKGKRYSYEKCNFNNMFACLMHIVCLASQPEYDIFSDNGDSDRRTGDIICLLRDKSLRKNFDDCCPSKKKLQEALGSMKIPDDRREMQDKLERLANSTFDKSSDPDKESFAERMKRIMEEFSFLEPTDAESKNKDFWEKIKRELIKNDFLNIRDILINCVYFSKKDVSVVIDLLEITSKNTNAIPLLKNFGNVRMLSTPKVRRDLFVTMALSIYFNRSFQDVKNLSGFFGQLTQEERLDVMCSDVQWKGRSLPLLLVFLLQNELRGTTISLINNFVPEVFDIKFKVDGKKTFCNIIELLKEIKDFCNKRLEEGCEIEKKRSFYDDLLKELGVEHTISRLKETKEQHALKPESKKKIKLELGFKRSPNTKIEVADKKEYEISDCCLVNLFRCAVAKFR